MILPEYTILCFEPLGKLFLIALVGWLSQPGLSLVSSFTLSLQCCNQTKLRRPAACLACSLDEVQGGDVVFRDLILVKVAGWVVLQKVPVAKCQIFSTKDLSITGVKH